MFRKFTHWLLHILCLVTMYSAYISVLQYFDLIHGWLYYEVVLLMRNYDEIVYFYNNLFLVEKKVFR